jgi:hypothetical protein
MFCSGGGGGGGGGGHGSGGGVIENIKGRSSKIIGDKQFMAYS